LKAAAGFEKIPVSQAVLGQVAEFITGRLRVVLLDMGYRYDVVDAVLAAQSGNPAGARRATGKLGEWVTRPDWNAILPGYARCVRILRSVPEENTRSLHVDEAQFSDPAERDLYAALKNSAARQPATVDEFLTIVAALLPAINTFFDQVLVMAEDKKVRRNRLALVAQVANLSNGITDLSTLEGF
jgi:glycyl-tRNA synthetase beta subunit